MSEPREDNIQRTKGEITLWFALEQTTKSTLDGSEQN